MSAQSALATLKAIPGVSEAEAQFVLAQSRGETGWGSGWSTPSKKTIAESQVFGLRGDEGAGSFNWGAVHGKGSAGSFMHVDHRTDGTPYITPFKKYASDAEGALDVVRLVLKANVRAAIANTRSIVAAAKAMKDNFYYEATVPQYSGMILNNYNLLTKQLGWNPLLSENGNASSNPPLSPALPPVPPHRPFPLSWPLPDSILQSILRVGSKGSAVEVWQQILKMRSVDGLFGPMTAAETIKFQFTNNLVSDGVVGPKTWRKAIDLYGI